MDGSSRSRRRWIFEYHHVRGDRVQFRVRKRKRRHAPAGNPLADQIANRFLRGRTRPAYIDNIRTMSAARAILAVAADTTGLVLRLTDFVGLGAKRQRSAQRDEKNSHRIEQAKACST